MKMFLTHRATVPALESRIGKKDKILDHGFIRLVDYMGDDAAITEAARVSYGSGTKTVRENRGLIRYLLRHRHTSPFEMCEIKLHIKMPIFVARQWIRHRMASVNEYSARYSILGQEFYLPELDRLARQSQTNKQGSGDLLDPDATLRCRELMKHDQEEMFDCYSDLLDEGLARELSRTVLPLSTYTEMYWKIDLHNLLHFLALRLDEKAQYEIRVYAEAIHELVRAWVPLTAEAFRDYRLDSISISGPMKTALFNRMRGQTVTQENSGLSMGEWREFLQIIEDQSL